ncbi:DUF4279 domain-containing protein [Shewanella nanhaiensis]|uniref:DUF4279 domain-containing protein n=1 Tax=Shewanella nanhaiensis TaxID=2864872 RepID=A0ABS7EAL7_9GAMM|nr:DUF4279 domain-containing protein [Shewanella nanhaiensis]MBW8186720.1 DUF4279 domain-containing protein [Shewanella nanhaiensis]
MEEFDTYAYFWVEGFECSIDEISSILKLQPTDFHLKGDLISERHMRLRKRSSWKYKSTLPRSEPFQDAHLENLLIVLKDRKEAIAQLNKDYDVGINCVGYYTNVNPGFHMSANLIKSYAELGLSIDFDLYNSCEPDSDNA